MMITEEMIAEDEKRWNDRNIVAELGYCGKNICNRKNITNDDIRFYAYIMRQAHAMLKEQEARVMTLDEIKAFDWDYCYLEEERLPGKEYRAVCGDYALTCITWPCITSMRIQHGDDSYGKKWRCWSAKPTDEQRKAVKWNERR